jgi:hypothetical protein
MNMSIKQTITATVTGAVALFLFDGALQAIPDFGVRAVERLETNELTTRGFDELTDRMAYVVTEQTVSFVATKSADYYDLSRFFAVELLSAFAIAFIFALLFAKIGLRSLRDRLFLTLGFAIVASFSIHIPYFN